MEYSFFFTYYSILIFSNFSPIILFTSPIILNYAQSKQLSNSASSLQNVYIYRDFETTAKNVPETITYYSSIILNSLDHLLFSKLCIIHQGDICNDEWSAYHIISHQVAVIELKCCVKCMHSQSVSKRCFLDNLERVSKIAMTSSLHHKQLHHKQ